MARVNVRLNLGQNLSLAPDAVLPCCALMSLSGAFVRFRIIVFHIWTSNSHPLNQTGVKIEKTKTINTSGVMEYTDILQAVASLVFVLGLIGLCALGVKRFGPAVGTVNFRSKPNRLCVIESCSIDPRTRLVLVKRDEQEHLLLLGAHGQTVIDTPADVQPPSEPDVEDLNPYELIVRPDDRPEPIGHGNLPKGVVSLSELLKKRQMEGMLAPEEPV